MKRKRVCDTRTGNEREEEKEGKRKYAFIPFITFGIDKNSIYKH